MAIRNDQELSAAISQCSELLQNIQDYAKEHNKIARVRFPRGFIRTVSEIRSSVSFLNGEVLRRNVSYAIVYIDVLRWLTNRTDIMLTAQNMVLKHAICCVGSICETLTICRGAPGLGRGHSFTSRTQKLVELGIINRDLKESLDWIWGIRRNEHLMEIDSLEHENYTKADANKAYRTFEDLAAALQRNHDREAAALFRGSPPN